MAKMKLMYSPTSPYVRKVMVLAIEAGLDKKIDRETVATTPVAPNRDLAKTNPLVKVPSLRAEGLSLYDSPVICEYLDSKHRKKKFFPAKGKARFNALRQQALGDGMLEAAILGRYESVRPEQYRWQEWIDAQLRKVRGALAALDKAVEDGELGPVSGAVPTIGQITIGCALGYLEFRYQSEEWQTRWRRLATWYGDFAQRKSMQLTAPRA